MPKLSIIIPTFNSEKVISTSIESIINQSFTDFEILIIDGLSTDNTLNIAKNYADNRIKIVSEKDKGIYDAMNKGIEIANGEWLYFLGSDDTLFDNEVLRRVFITHEAIIAKSDYVYANVIWGDGYVYTGYSDVFSLYESNISHQAIFAKKQVFKKTGLFILKYPLCADFYFNMQCFTNDSIKKSYLRIIIARFAVGGASSYLEDPFFSEKYELFEQHLKNISFEHRLKFRIRYRNTTNIDNKIKFMLDVVIYNILDNFFVRKLRKILNEVKNG